MAAPNGSSSVLVQYVRANPGCARANLEALFEGGMDSSLPAYCIRSKQIHADGPRHCRRYFPGPKPPEPEPQVDAEEVPELAREVFDAELVFIDVLTRLGAVAAVYQEAGVEYRPDTLFGLLMVNLLPLERVDMETA